ncbi:MAG: S1 RNA-binding domain-containing protein, partial [Acidobacteria bacterium]|nr:S1 RNA-binding domain-containing protein [Acidobacteriota bacterium]
ILPGRDGLLHISKMSPLNDGKRINNVEDVLELGQAIEVKVDDIDPQGKVSLSLAGVEYPAAEPREPRERRERRDDRPRDDRPTREGRPARSSFEESFEAELADELGDLGPGGPNLGGEDRGPRRRRR